MKTPPWLQEHPEGSALMLYIAPRASKSAVVGPHDDMLKVQVAAPPVDGKANKVLLKFLAGALGVPKGHLHILSGDTGRRKRVLAQTLEPAQVLEALGLSPAE
jgi:uncharacterized protein (TIGR00251 family)